MSQPKTRKYSRKNIRNAPKTARQYRKCVNQILWRKYHAKREDVGLTLSAVASAYKAGELSADALVASVIKA